MKIKDDTNTYLEQNEEFRNQFYKWPPKFYSQILLFFTLPLTHFTT